MIDDVEKLRDWRAAKAVELAIEAERHLLWLRDTWTVGRIQDALRDGVIDFVAQDASLVGTAIGAAIISIHDQAGRMAMSWFQEQLGAPYHYDSSSLRVFSATQKVTGAASHLMASDQLRNASAVRSRAHAYSVGPELEAQIFHDTLGLSNRTAMSTMVRHIALRNDAKASVVLTARIDETVRSLIRTRAVGLAQTETNRAMHIGIHEAVQQVAERGALGTRSVARTWHASTPGRHGSLNGLAVGGPFFFTSERGNRLRFPGDADGHASEVVGCQCVTTVAVLP